MTRPRPEPPARPGKLSDAEWTVMNAVWEGAPASVREVLERTQARTGWSYSTVKTLLARLVEKGALAVEKRGNAGWFRPLLTRERARRSALRSLLDKAFDGTFGSLVQHVVREERLGRRDRERLRAMLAELDERDAPDDPDTHGEPRA